MFRVQMMQKAQATFSHTLTMELDHLGTIHTLRKHILGLFGAFWTPSLLCKHILCTENKQSMLFSNPLPPKSAYVIYEWPLSEPETKAVKLATDYIIQDHGPDK